MADSNLYLGDLVATIYPDQYTDQPDLTMLEMRAVFLKNNLGYELIEHGELLSTVRTVTLGSTYFEENDDADVILEESIHVYNLKKYQNLARRR